MHCGGFSSDTYDRYVLGLLEEPDRSQLEGQIQEQCPACLTGVQRSMNLWLVFAETLEGAEPSEDFRGRIVRIAELSRKVLTFPKNSAVRERPTVPISTLVIICGVTCVLLLATWYAARAWTRADRPTSTADIEALAQQLATTKLKLDQATDRVQKAESEMGQSGRAAMLKSKSDEDLRLKAQAQAGSNISREANNTSALLETFAKIGARLLPMKATEAAGKGLGYTIFGRSALVFVGSNLPAPAAGHTFQFWILRSEAPEAVAAGFMPPGTAGSWLLHYEDATMLTSMIGVLVTEEPIQGDYEKPTGPRLFEATTTIEQE